MKSLKDLGVDVVMTQVEDAEHLAALWNWGVDYACGDFIQAPLETPSYSFE